MKHGTFLFTAFLSLSTNAFADFAALGQLSSYGEGCPQGSASANISGSRIDVNFGSYVVQAGSNTGRPNASKTCTVNVPVQVSPNQQVSVLVAEYRGANRLPAGAGSQLDVEYFFAGNRGPLTSRAFAGQLNSGFALRDEVRPQAKVWSPCGQGAIIRINSTLRVNNPSRQQDGSIDVNVFSYMLESRPCRG